MALFAGVGPVLAIAAHGLVAWGSIASVDSIRRWGPWLGAGALFGWAVFHVVRHALTHRHAHGTANSGFGGSHVDRGPHDGALVSLGHGFVEITIVETDAGPRFRIFFQDKHRQPRAVPRNATVRIETVRADDTRHVFEFLTCGNHLESATGLPRPYAFTAVLRVSHGTHAHTHKVRFPN